MRIPARPPSLAPVCESPGLASAAAGARDGGGIVATVTRARVNNSNGLSQWEQSPKLGARPEAFRQKTSMNLSVEAERPWHCRLTMLLAM